MTDKPDNVDFLPIWKKGSTAEEWLFELAAVARKYPERWARVVVVFEKLNEAGQPIECRFLSRNIATNQEIIGALAAAQL